MSQASSLSCLIGTDERHCTMAGKQPGVYADELATVLDPNKVDHRASPQCTLFVNQPSVSDATRAFGLKMEVGSLKT